MKIASLPGNSLFYTNLYILYQPGQSDCIVVDPGELQDETQEFLEQNGLVPAAYLLTHPHIDHFSGLCDFIAKWPAPVWLHPKGLRLYEEAAQQAAMFGLGAPDLPEIDNWYATPQDLEIGGMSLKIRHTPGHSPGCVILLFDEDDAEDGIPSVIAGDVLFSGSIGRADLPGGDMGVLLDSIKRELLTLPDETRVYSGHGPATTIGKERHSNPYLQGLSS
jgi:hydroxyacylglutathione hydrolase